jgi:hypothetical protein
MYLVSALYMEHNILRICYYGLWAISSETVYCIAHTCAEDVTVVQSHPLKCITVIHNKTS